MANGLYDDGGVSFAEEQFEQQREREDKERKKQQRKQNALYALNLGVAGANWFINQKADKLERDNIVARAHYLDANESAKNWNTMVQEYEKLGYSREQMFFEEKKKQLRNHLLSIYGEDFNIDGYNDAINRIARDFSDNEVNFNAWNKAVDAQLKIPGLSQEEMINVIQTDGAPPRSIGAFFGNKLFKLAKSHDKETLTEEDKLAKNASLGGLLGEQFNNAKVALKAYGEIGNPIDELVEFMKTDEGKKITVYRNAEVKTAENIVEDKYGGKTKVTFATTIAQAPDGSPVQIGDAIPMGSYTITGERKVRKDDELETGIADITAYINRTNDVDLTEFYKKDFKDNPRSYTNNILDTAEGLMDTQGLSKPQAIAAATEYVAKQDSIIIDTNMSLFDLDNMQGTVDTEKLPQYIDSIRNVKPEYGVEQELRGMRDTVLQAIKESDLDEQQKDEEELALNSIMKSAGIVPANEYNEIVINESNEAPEVKTFLQEMNDIPYAGRVSEFMFGDELDLLDATWLIPGYGLLKIGGKVTSRLIVPQVANKIIKSPTGQASIKKIRQRLIDGFENNAAKDAFYKGLNPLEQTIFRAMSRTGKTADTAMLPLFRQELARTPGLYIKGIVPSVGRTLGWGLAGSLFAYGQYTQSRPVVPEKQDIED
mgnify:FL=1|tara:strand:+ start:3771 stop:5738 length:1968 start_codon:yes stop_codon:yes gene_type:complete